jgi:PAS domain S-box-containing protein
LQPKQNEVDNLLHDLHVHQAELELQNQELRESQQALEASRARYADLFDFAPIGYITLDAHVSVVEINLAAAALLGCRREDVLGKPFRALGRVVPRDAMSDHVCECMGSNRVVRRDVTFYRRSDGAELCLDVQSLPIRDPDGVTHGCRTTLVDLTDRRRAERERAEAIERERTASLGRQAAEQASHLKDEFLGVVSHELRTPLNAILGWAHVLTSSPALDPVRAMRGLEVIRRNAEAQQRLVEDLLDVSRIITGKLRIDLRRPVRLSTIVRAAIDAMQQTAAARRVALLLHLRSDPRVMADSDRLQQVVWNLVSNAVKFTTDAGRVDVTVDADDSHARVSVRDTGCGIDPASLPWIFERFRQVDSSPSRMHGGLGLGLAIVRHLVELHGGRVWGESDGVGRGSTFCLELPIAPGSAGPSIPPPPPLTLESPQSLSGLRVLVVEDNEDSRSLAATLLEAAGAVVAVAPTVAQGLAAFARLSPQVVVSDLGLPGEDGFALLRQIRALPAPARDVPFVAMTAYARAEDVEFALAAGFDDHVSKPMTPRALVECVGRVARGREARGRED